MRPSRGRRRLPPSGRLTVNLEAEDAPSSPTPPSRRASRPTFPSSSSARSTGRRSPAHWQEAHNSFGVTQTAPRWGLAEGQAGLGGLRADLHPAREHQRLGRLGSRSSSFASSTRRSSRPTTSRRTRASTSRSGRSAPSSQSSARSASARSSPAPGGPIVVERAVYYTRDGIIWSAADERHRDAAAIGQGSWPLAAGCRGHRGARPAGSQEARSRQPVAPKRSATGAVAPVALLETRESPGSGGAGRTRLLASAAKVAGAEPEADKRDGRRFRDRADAVAHVDL